MKTYCIAILAFITLGSSLKAQFYHKITDTSNKWNVLCGGITTNGNDLRQTDILQFAGDTLIYDTVYQKLYSHTHYTQSDSEWVLKACLREDTIQKQVFIRNYSEDFKIFDFMLNVNDSMVTGKFYNSIYKYVKVDSIHYINFANKLRKTYYLSSYEQSMGSFMKTGNIQWIDGIGIGNTQNKIIGPVENIEVIIDQLLCFSQSGVIEYQNTAYQSCIIVHVGVENIKQPDKFSLYPNPVIGNIIIEINQPENECMLIIYNTMGKEQLRILLNNQHSTVDISKLPNGIYLAKLINSKGFEIKKLLKR
jgi:hypothetical protein